MSWYKQKSKKKLLMLNEIMSWYKQKSKKMLLFKVDFEKAYDSVNWEYLMFMMTSLGFSQKWCSWIKGCLYSARTSVLVNGSPTREFEIKRGLRQGDSLSPFLFIMVMEGLHLAFQRAMEINFIQGISVGADMIHLSHFIYADDVIIFSDWSVTELRHILLILEIFYRVSGLRLNVSKSHIFGIGVSDEEILTPANVTGARVGSFPTTYLGIPIGVSMNKIANWEPLRDKFCTKLSSWKASLISSGGRLTYTSTIFLGGSQTTKRMAWVKWEKVLATFDNGGLNKGSLKAFNLALLFKWRWRYLTNPNDMWVTIIKSIHGNVFEKVATSSSSVWTTIVASCSKLISTNALPADILKFEVGNGTLIRFWHDLWCGNSTLSARYNRLFHLDSNPDSVIVEKVFSGNWSFSWNINITRGRNVHLLRNLLEEIGTPRLTDKMDSWVCNFSKDKLFYVKVVRDKIDHSFLPTSQVKTIWFNFVPRKINVFLWRFRLDSLPVRWNLSAKGIDVASIVCPNCNNGTETREHLFVDCSVANDVWRKIIVWLDCNIPHFSNWDSFVVWLEGVHLSSSTKNRIVAVMVTYLCLSFTFVVKGCKRAEPSPSLILFELGLFDFQKARARARLGSSFRFLARARLVIQVKSSSSARFELVNKIC
ncbi:uncharacterized protein [Rutidosis leptorrhynchoides]|uniref:uncharacterized protein n=1 Tax=Rutidosis leptorrhynchoides TaxID=125765 RepID=UPI003A9A1069